MNVVFLVEEPSMKWVLEALLPKILREDVRYFIIPHEGKGDLIKSIPTKLKGWNLPDTKFVIVHDQDDQDCKKLKTELITIKNR